jgi:hypothetical protein
LDVGSGKGREQTDIATERIVGKVVTEREGERKDGAYMWVNIRHDWKGWSESPGGRWVWGGRRGITRIPISSCPLYYLISYFPGLGISNYFTPDELCNPVLKSIAIVSSIFFTRGMEYVKPPQEDPTLYYYILTFIKNFSLPVVIPKIMSVFQGSSDGKRDWL